MAKNPRSWIVRGFCGERGFLVAGRSFWERVWNVRSTCGWLLTDRGGEGSGMGGMEG